LLKDEKKRDCNKINPQGNDTSRAARENHKDKRTDEQVKFCSAPTSGIKDPYNCKRGDDSDCRGIHKVFVRKAFPCQNQKNNEEHPRNNGSCLQICIKAEQDVFDKGEQESQSAEKHYPGKEPLLEFERGMIATAYEA
jgi:hypothetical protein